MHETDDPKVPPPHVLAALRRPRWRQRFDLASPAEKDRMWQAMLDAPDEIIILDDPDGEPGDEVLPRGTGAPPPHVLQALWEDDRESAMAQDAGKDEPGAGAGKPMWRPFRPSPFYIHHLRETGQLREPDEDARAGAVQEPKLADRVPGLVGPVARPVLGPHPNAVSKGRPHFARPIHRTLSDTGRERIVRRLAREKGVRGVDE